MKKHFRPKTVNTQSESSGLLFWFCLFPLTINKYPDLFMTESLCISCRKEVKKHFKISQNTCCKNESFQSPMWRLHAACFFLYQKNVWHLWSINDIATLFSKSLKVFSPFMWLNTAKKTSSDILNWLSRGISFSLLQGHSGKCRKEKNTVGN